MGGLEPRSVQKVEIDLAGASSTIRTLEEKLAAYKRFAEAHEVWEAQLIMDEKELLLTNLTDTSYEEMLRIQALRNEAMKS